MKWAYTMVLGVAGATMTGGLTGCSDTTVRALVEAKGDNKLHVSNIADSNAYYVVDCGTFFGGVNFYNNVAPGDTITGKYMACRNCIYLSGAPKDTTARCVIKRSRLPEIFCDAVSAEDQIIKDLIISRRACNQQTR